MEYLTANEVAQYLKISIRSAQRLIRCLPHINAGLGAKRENPRIARSVLDEYLSSARHSPVHSLKNNRTQKRIRNTHHTDEPIYKIPRR